MRDYGGEQILVVPRALFDGIGAFNGIRSDISEAVGTLLDPQNHFFMDRAAAEEDPGHKQIILYCIFRHGGRFLRYTRGKSGGESRLHSLGSIGIGGHVNPIDASEGRFGTDAYHAAVRREIDEELVIGGSWSERIVALLSRSHHYFTAPVASPRTRYRCISKPRRRVGAMSSVAWAARSCQKMISSPRASDSTIGTVRASTVVNM